jgi:hypothetical protein
MEGIRWRRPGVFSARMLSGICVLGTVCAFRPIMTGVQTMNSDNDWVRMLMGVAVMYLKFDALQLRL